MPQWSLYVRSYGLSRLPQTRLRNPRLTRNRRGGWPRRSIYVGLAFHSQNVKVGASDYACGAGISSPYAWACCVAGHSACAAIGRQGDVSHTSTELGPCMKSSDVSSFGICHGGRDEASNSQARSDRPLVGFTCCRGPNPRERELRFCANRAASESRVSRFRRLSSANSFPEPNEGAQICRRQGGHGRIPLCRRTSGGARAP